MSAASPISVVMSVYNCERYLELAIESVLNQTFGDFEFIIINDGSTDGTSAILDRYEQLHDRISVYRQDNQGLIPSLNRGCRIARGKYIARMDADDISLPERFARQLSHLETHPQIGVLGTRVEYIDEGGLAQGKWRVPTSASLTRWSLLFGNSLAHPSVMMRRGVIERLGFYRPCALHVEDYDLWVRASEVTEIANIPDILLQRRYWEGSICSRHSQAQEEAVAKVMHLMITRLLGSGVAAEAVVSLRRVIIGSPVASPQEIDALASLVQQLYRAYLKTNSPNHAEAHEVAQDAGMKLLTLAVSASRVSPRKGLGVFIQALRLDPLLLVSKEIITKGMKRAVRRA